MLFALERVGAVVTGKSGTLKKFREELTEVGRRSPLAEKVPSQHPALHIKIATLYSLVQTARNEAMHQGAYARHHAQHAIELSLILEDAFMNGSNCISDYMVKSPICAEPWQPVSLIRQQMLTNSFSFLPVSLDGRAWKLVSDYGLAKFLRTPSNGGERARRLEATLKEALEKFELELLYPILATPDTTVSKVLSRAGADGRPILVTENQRLLGIATPYDLL
jgi:CBS domain-containing protein